jgi:hypothetical protein
MDELYIASSFSWYLLVLIAAGGFYFFYLFIVFGTKRAMGWIYGAQYT